MRPQDWLEAVRRTIAKRNSGMGVPKCIDTLGEWVDTAVDQFERRLEVRVAIAFAVETLP